MFYKLFNYLFKLTSSCNISSAVVIPLLLAWKPLWYIIIFVNSVDKSTLDISNVLDVKLPAESPGTTALNSPELAVSTYELSPTLFKPV